MKKIILVITSIFFSLLDWAAIHDIIKGNETNYIAEYALIGLSIVFYTTALFLLLRKKSHIATS